MAGESQCRFCGSFYACFESPCRLSQKEKDERFGPEKEDHE